MALQHFRPEDMRYGLAPARFAGAFPTRVQIPQLEYLGKPSPAVYNRVLPIIQQNTRTFVYREFDRGGLVFGIMGGTAAKVPWSPLYFPFPHQLWEMLGFRSRVYMIVSKVLVRGDQPYYTSPHIPGVLRARWSNMEREHLNGLVTYTPLTNRETVTLADDLEEVTDKAFKLTYNPPVPQQTIPRAARTLDQILRAAQGIQALDLEAQPQTAWPVEQLQVAPPEQLNRRPLQTAIAPRAPGQVIAMPAWTTTATWPEETAPMWEEQL